MEEKNNKKLRLRSGIEHKKLQFLKSFLEIGTFSRLIINNVGDNYHANRPLYVQNQVANQSINSMSNGSPCNFLVVIIFR